MNAAQRRIIAEQCLKFAWNGDFKRASQIRQAAYAIDPPGSIGVDWSNQEYIWNLDKRELHQIQSSDFSDLENSSEYIQYFQASMFIDQLFDFRDFWAIKRLISEVKEKMCCPLLEIYLKKNDWSFDCVTREFIYADTKRRNIIAYNMKNTSHSTLSFFKPIARGEYFLGFCSDTPQRVIDGRREFLRNLDQYEHMQQMNIEKFPKTFQTFLKHKQQKSEKYAMWMQIYSQKKSLE